MLGIEPAGGTLAVDPLVPEQCGRIELRGVHAFGRRFDVTAEGAEGRVVAAG